MTITTSEAVVATGGIEAGAEAFAEFESRVRLYSGKFPVVFHRAKGADLYSEHGRRYTDFFCGAGTLNYGHNNDFIKNRVVRYLQQDGVLHGLDMHTVAKRDFLLRFAETVLAPRELDYKVQFCGPTGTDAVEAALKLARKVTGRVGVVSFAGGYHGMSRGSLGVTGNLRARRAGGVSGQDVAFVPYEDGPHGPFDSLSLLERMFDDSSSGVDLPAAVIVEPMQMEGGMYPASAGWLRGLRELTERHGVLLVLDEIQAGCGRTGRFFCFEHAGIVPDIVTLSKAVGGIGMPLALTLLRRELDVWEPGEHTGTFRGNQLAFVAATAACELWAQPRFQADLGLAAHRMIRFRDEVARRHPMVVTRGLGMALGIDLSAAGGQERALRVQRHAFTHGLLVETCGRRDEVVKVLPPLAIDLPRLDRGLTLLDNALAAG